MKRKPLPLILISALLLSTMIVTQFTNSAKAQTYSTIAIKADGSIEGTEKIQREGNIYTFIANISGVIQVQKSNIIIDGAGYALQGNGGTGIDLTNNLTEVPSPQAIWNVTIKNLAILGFYFGIYTLGGGNDTLYGDYVVTSMSGSACAVSFWSCGGNNVSYCSIAGKSAVAMQLGSRYNTITENNIAGNVWVELAGDETVDKNYWSDYLTKYPNATEIDKTGTGDTPYVFYYYINNGSGLFKTPLYDYHPQINPITINLFPTLAIPEFPTWAVLPFVIIATLLTAIIVKRKKAQSCT